MHSTVLGWRVSLFLAVTAFIVGCGGPPDDLAGPDQAVAAAAATQLAFTVEPTTTSAGATITPAVEVTARDAQGNTATGFTGNITLTISTNPSGAVLLGTRMRPAVAGVATFNDLSIKKAGAGYTLRAASGTRTPATSGAFDITPGVATQLVAFGVPDAVAGVTISPAVQVRAIDAFANTATSFTGNVTLTIVQGPPGGALFGTTTVTAVAGVATFSDLSIKKASKPALKYILHAASGTFAANSSPGTNITPAAATRIAFSVQPSITRAGEKISPAVRVTAFDPFDNVATGFTGNVSMAIGNNPSGGTLGGTTTWAAVAGVATFAGTLGLTIDKTGTGYTLVATSGEFAPATSVAFDITPGAPAQLAFTVQPSNTAPGATITPAVQVTARDAQGNTATGFTGPVTLAIDANPGGGVLAGTKTRNAVAGVATFANLSINALGNGYTLQATSPNRTPATSAAFDIKPPGDFWTPQAPLPVQLHYMAVAALNGTLYAVGGFGISGQSANTLYAYDPVNNMWSTKASMSGPRASMGVAVIQGKLYAVGGQNNTPPYYLKTLEVYDPVFDTWTTLEPMPTARYGLAAAAIHDTLYAIGGIDPITGYLDVVEAYDPTTDKWETRAPMPTARYILGAVAINNILYAVDGSNNAALKMVEAYDPGSNTWTTKTPMPTERNGLGVAAINGIIYAAGGYNGNWLTTLEAYDPITGASSTKAPMPTARVYLAAAAINGILYAVGGHDGNSAVKTVEAYHP
jgi:N-acetylneuraminic acid mutarotase